MKLEWEQGETKPTGEGDTFRPGTWRPDVQEEYNPEVDQKQTPLSSTIDTKHKRQPSTPPKNPS